MNSKEKRSIQTYLHSKPEETLSNRLKVKHLDDSKYLKYKALIHPKLIVQSARSATYACGKFDFW